MFAEYSSGVSSNPPMEAGYMSLKIGVVGAGRGSGPAGVFARHKDCELVALADRNPDRLAEVAGRLEVPHAYPELDDMLETDIDVVFVATPAPVHAENSIAALRAGKHVMCEVPAMPTIESGRELVQTVKETGLKYSFAENMYYYPYIGTYERLIQDGDLGEIVYAEGEYIHQCDSLMCGRPDGLGGGLDGGLTWRASLPPILYCTHDLQPLLRMFRDRCVTAVGMNTGSRRRPDLGVIDIGVGLFKTAKDITIKQLCGFSVAKEPAHHWFCIYGTKGSIEQGRGCSGLAASHYLYVEDRYDNHPGPVKLDIPPNHPGAPPEATLGGHGTSEYFMVDEFVQCVLNDTDPPIDVYEACDCTFPGICAHISAEAGGEPVEVPDPREW